MPNSITEFLQSRGLTLSIVFHALVLLIVAFGFPALFKLKKDPEPMAISVEILPIKSKSNVPNRQAPVRKQEPKPAEQAKPTPPKPTPPKAAPPPPPKKESVAVPDKKKPDPVKKEEKPKKVEEKKEPPKKNPSDDFEDVLRNLQDETPKAEKKTPTKNPTPDSTKSRSDNYDPTLPLSISEKDAIRSQLAQCWRMPAGVRGDYELAVEVRVLLNQDGSVRQAGIERHQAGRYNSDVVFRAAADSALRAVKQCSPLKNLPMDKYNNWKDMVVNFDPSEMLY